MNIVTKIQNSYIRRTENKNGRESFFLIDTLTTKNGLESKEFIKKNLGDESEFIFLHNTVPSKCKKCKAKKSYITGIHQTIDKKKIIVEYLCPNCNEIISEYLELDPYYKSPSEITE